MKINNLDWSVKYNDDMQEGTFGETNYETLTIYLRTQCHKQNMRRTLLHEIIHAYQYSFGLHFIESFNKETICEFIAHNFEAIGEIYNQAKKEIGL